MSRTRKLQIWLNDVEYEELTKLAASAQVSRAEYIRDAFKNRNHAVDSQPDFSSSPLQVTISKNPGCEVFRLGLPPTMNEITRFMGRPLEEFSSFWEECMSLLTKRVSAFTDTSTPFAGKVWIEYCWVVRNWRRDPDNIFTAAKFINDALVRAKVIKDDSLNVIHSPLIHHYRKRDKTDGKHDYVWVYVSDFPPRVYADSLQLGCLCEGED